MKYLITGNLGYIGPVLSKFIKKIDINNFIIGYDTGYFLNCELASELNNETPTVDIQIFGDVRDKLNIAKYIEQVDYVIHLAAISNDPMGQEFEKVTKDINENASAFIAEKAIENKCKSFIFASSCSVYGAGSDSPRKEGDKVNPLTAYAKSKIGTENKLMSINNYQNTKITCLRFATACGYSPNLRLDLVLNDFVATGLNKKEIEILSNGKPWRPLIDVEDMSRAIYWACHRKKGEEIEILNIGSPDWNYQIDQLANSVKDLIGDDIIVKINKDAPPDKRSYRVAFDKFYSLVDDHLKPQVSLEESVRRLIREIAPYRDRVSKENRGYLIRLNVLRYLKTKNLVNSELFWNKLL